MNKIRQNKTIYCLYDHQGFTRLDRLDTNSTFGRTETNNQFKLPGWLFKKGACLPFTYLTKQTQGATTLKIMSDTSNTSFVRIPESLTEG